MKKIFIVSTFILCSAKDVLYGQAAQKILEGVKEVQVHNIGAIRSAGVVKGYFSFYEYDKADKHSLIYKLSLTDENLNPLGTKDIIGSDKKLLLSSAYDGKNFCFKFWDNDENTIEMKVFNQQGEELASNVENTKYEPTNMNNFFYQAVDPELSVIDNGGGFINYSFYPENKGFFVNYVDGTTKRKWNKAYDPGHGYKIIQPTFIGADQTIILTAVSIIGKGDNGERGGNFLLASDPKNGAEVFNVSTDGQGSFMSPISATVAGDKISVIGLIYTSPLAMTATPEGIAFIDMDRKGKVLNKVVRSFDQTIGKFQTLDKFKFEDKSFPFIHQVSQMPDGNTVMLIEKFKSSFMGGLSLGNMVVIVLDKNYNYIQGKEIQKEVGTASTGVAQMGGSYFAANNAKNHDQLDFLYSQYSEDKSSIAFSFVEREIKARKGVYNLKSFGQIKYENGKITTDKVPFKNELNEDATATWVYPAKTGYFLEANYFKKQKQLKMNFVKLNN